MKEGAGADCGDGEGDKGDDGDDGDGESDRGDGDDTDRGTYKVINTNPEV